MATALRYEYRHNQNKGTRTRQPQPAFIECKILVSDTNDSHGDWIPRRLHTLGERIVDGVTELSGFITSEDSRFWKAEISCRTEAGKLYKVWPNEQPIACFLNADADRHPATGDQRPSEELLECSILQDTEENPILLGEVPSRYLTLPAPSLRRPFVWKNRDNTNAQEYSLDICPMPVENLSSITVVVAHCVPRKVKRRQGTAAYVDAERNPEALLPLAYSKQFKHANLTHAVCLSEGEPMPAALAEDYEEADLSADDNVPFLRYTFYYASEESLQTRGLLKAETGARAIEQNLARSSLEPDGASTSSSSNQRAGVELGRGAGKRRREDTPPGGRRSGTPELPYPSRAAGRSQRMNTSRESASAVHPRPLNSTSESRDGIPQLGTALQSRTVSQRVIPPLRPPTARTHPAASTSPAPVVPLSGQDEETSDTNEPGPDLDTPGLSSGSRRRHRAPSASLSTAPSNISAGTERVSSSARPANPSNEQAPRALTSNMPQNTGGNVKAPDPESTMEDLLKYAYQKRPIDPATFEVLQEQGCGKDMKIQEVQEALERCDDETKVDFFRVLSEAMPRLMFGAVKKQLAR